jgi:hypothetical protein
MPDRTRAATRGLPPRGYGAIDKAARRVKWNSLRVVFSLLAFGCG